MGGLCASGTTFGGVVGKAIGRKPLWVFEREAVQEDLQPTFGFWSLLAIGIGGTVGSGIFVLSGEIASTMAGPATAISFLIAGCICALTALAYIELAAVLMSPGSTYSFASFGLGESVAVVAGFLVTLEYGVSGAAVSRSWGDKLGYWLDSNGWMDCPPDNCWINALNGSSFNPAAMVLSALMVGLILNGANVEKGVVTVLVAFKVLLVLFVIVTGAVYTNPENLTPFVPPPNTAHNGTALPGFEGGVSGVMMGATSAFFAFIGFDEVTCMVAETKNAKRNIPLAVLLTILIITSLYFVASIVLTGMVPYDQISKAEGFGSAFDAVGASWAKQVTVVGEVFIALPSVVLVSYIPQSRIFYAMSKDGHLPRIFARVNSRGTLFWGGLLSGIVMTLIAALVPFSNLNDLISGGILFSFILTNTSLMLTRSKHEAQGTTWGLVAVMGVTCFLLNKGDPSNSPATLAFAVIGLVASVGIVAFLGLRHSFAASHDSFAVPLVPITPSVAIFVNWYLFSQLSWLGIGLVVAFVALATLVYMFYGFHHAVDYRGMEADADAELDKIDLAQVTVQKASSQSDNGGPAESEPPSAMPLHMAAV